MKILLPSPEWQQIRDLSYQIVRLTQRQDFFWGLPTTESEIHHTFAPAGSTENVERKKEKFGHPSITVSYRALTALVPALEQGASKITSATLKAILSHRAPEGGYGSPYSRRDDVEINAVPRHTAMGLLSALVFAPKFGFPIARDKVVQSVIWLLGTRSRKSGWPYDHKSKSPEFGFLSTSSSIAALCLYLDHFLDCPSDQKAKIEVAIVEAFAALELKQNNGAWTGDGIPIEYQIRDSAFAIQLMYLADRNGRLSGLIDGGRGKIGSLLQHFVEIALRDGWAATVGENVANPQATVSGLEAISSSDGFVTIEASTLLKFENLILSAWKEGRLSASMTGWDWQCLLTLATSKVGPIKENDVQNIDKKILWAEDLARNAKFFMNDLNQFDTRIRKVVEFVLASGGGVLPSPKSFIRKVAAEFPSVPAKIVIGLVVALVFAVGSLILSKILGVTL